MSETLPSVYLFDGEDEFTIAQTVKELIERLGDPALAEMNTTRLDGNTFDPDQLLSAAGAMPFLARRRLVILTHPTARLNSPTARKKFLEQLSRIPPTTALILIEPKTLTADRDRRKNQVHWLEKWVIENPGRAQWIHAPQPKGDQLTQRIQKMVASYGGQMKPEAARALAFLVDGDLRLADQEIQKLLAYVNRQRPVSEEDVMAITADSNQGDIFELVDALAMRDARNSMRMLHRLLEYNDYFAIFGMITRQFRLLIQVREALDRGVSEGSIASYLKIHSFLSAKLVQQARRLTMSELENAYHRLLEVDKAVKTSQADGELALEIFVTTFTAAPTEPLFNY
jgi:DNA polymerase-3 subunit delta